MDQPEELVRVLFLDYDPLFGETDDTRDSFGSDISVFDYDVVIWDPAASIRTYHYYESYQGLPSLSDSESARLKADVQRRHAEFADFVKSGRTLIVIVSPPQTVYAATGEVQTSGTGRNASRTRIVARLDITSAIPVKDTTFVRASGDRIEVVGDGPIQSHLRANAKSLRYAATLEGAPGTVVAKVAGTDRAVASVVRPESGGLLALLPATTFEGEWDEDGGERSWPEEAPAFQESLLEALAKLDGNAEIDRPSWAERYATQKQIEVRAEVAKQETAIEKARSKLSKLQVQSDTVDLLDQLYLGTGRTLELRVADILSALGGEVTEPEPNRDDWRVDFNGTPAVVEIKGVTKSAAEKHAAQLEKWVAGAYADTGVTHKGIRVVNTWRDTPLGERTDVDFPSQMIPYSTGREHVLITGLELFIIAAEIDADSAKAEEWRERILNTSGRLSRVPDWRDYIQQIKTKE